MATVQQVYIAIFGRPADPDGLAYWNEQTNNGADLSAMINAFTAGPEYEARFEGMSNEEIITSIYQALFGREPDAEGLAFYLEALAEGDLSIGTIAIGILDGAQGNDQQIIENKTEAADQFTESLDTPEEIEAYQGAEAGAAGQDFLSKVTGDPETIPTQEETDTAIGGVVTPPPPDGGQEPDDGDDGDDGVTTPPTPDPDVAVLGDDGILTIANGANATMSESGDGESVIIQAPGFETFVIEKSDLQGVNISSGAQLSVAGSVVDSLANGLSIAGSGAINFTGVTITDATEGGPAISGITPSKLAFVIDTDFTDTSTIPDQEVPRILANGSQSDGIAFAWVYQDALYTSEGVTNGKLGTNLLGLEIAKQYAAMLDADPANAIFDFTAKYTEGSREQSLHDNLLGNAGLDSISGSRYGENATDPAAHGITPAQVDMLKDAQPDPYSERPYYSGNQSEADALLTVARWDEDLGINRPDHDSFIITFEANADGVVVGEGTTAYGAVDLATSDGELAAYVGDGYAVLTDPDNLNGPYTWFVDPRTDNAPEIFESSIAIYLDPEAGISGEGFDYSVAAAKAADGLHLRDFIIHTTVTDDGIFIDASNNSNYEPKQFDLMSDPGKIPTAGWYIYTHRMFEGDDGNLAVELSVSAADGTEIFSETRTNSNDSFEEYGGNYYGWFTNIDVTGGIAVDAWQSDAVYW